MKRCSLGESARLARGVRQPDRVGGVVRLMWRIESKVLRRISTRANDASQQRISVLCGGSWGSLVLSEWHPVRSLLSGGFGCNGTGGSANNEPFGGSEDTVQDGSAFCGGHCGVSFFG